MGDIASSHSTTQKTVNQQVGVSGTQASGASGSIGKGAAQAAGQGISLVFNTGNNKISTSSKNSGGINKPAKTPKAKSGALVEPGGAASLPTSITSPSNSSNQAGGNIAVTIAQTDQGALAAGTTLSAQALQLAQSANDALLQSNTNAVTLATAALQSSENTSARALQAGEDVASVAIPTEAAVQITQRPVDLAGIQAQTDQAAIAASAPALDNNTVKILTLIGIGLTAFLILKK